MLVVTMSGQKLCLINNFWNLQCESKKSSPPKTFCDIFTSGKPVLLKITVAIAQTYFYVYINFSPFI